MTYLKPTIEVLGEAVCKSNKPTIELLGEAARVIQGGKLGLWYIDAPEPCLGVPQPPPAYDLDE